MTLTEIISKVRELSRTTNTATSDTEITSWVNEGQRQFVKEGGGISGEDYLRVEAKFDTRTFFAIRIETEGSSAVSAQDVAITATDRTNATGTVVASDLETALQLIDADFSVSFNSDKTFTISQTGATNIIISSPSSDLYADATDLLFGGTCTAVGDSVTGATPKAVYVEADLPTDFHATLAVYWDDYLLRRRNFNQISYPSITGTPYYYAIKEKKIRFFPTPTKQGFVHMLYKKYPTELELASPSTEPDVPEEYHMLLVYYAASKVADSNFEQEIANRLYAFFKDGIKRYSRERANENSEISFRDTIDAFTMFGTMAERSLT